LNEPTDSREEVWLAALESALSQRAQAERVVGERMSRLSEAEHLAARQAETLAEIESSFSWRITAPLRWAKGWWLRRRGPANQPKHGPPGEQASTGLIPRSIRARGLDDRPWRREPTLPFEAADVVSMITPAERALLHWLARHYYSGDGAIVDAGCYLGGSTLALATGLDRRDTPVDGAPIYSYDLFRIDEGMTPDLFAAEGLVIGDSFRPIFERNLGSYGRFCNVVEGDIVQRGWVGDGPIEIAFIDILKCWRISQGVVEKFFPHFIPGRTILVQQDFVHEICPWIHITMAYLEPYFELLDAFDFGSAVYLLREPLPDEVLRVNIAEDLSANEKLALMDRAIEPFSGEMRGILECAKASLLYFLLGLEGMDAQLRYVEERYRASPIVAQCARRTSVVWRAVAAGGPQWSGTFHVPDSADANEASAALERQRR
jgi:hypothetical protein